MILKKINTDLTLENHLEMVFLDNMNGQIKLKIKHINLVYQVKDLKAQRKWFSQTAFTSMSHKQIKICTEKPMEISNQVNRKWEITTGNSTQMIIFSAMENKEFWMVLQKLSVLRDMEMISQKPSLPKRQLKISKVFPQIF